MFSVALPVSYKKVCCGFVGLRPQLASPQVPCPTKRAVDWRESPRSEVELHKYHGFVGFGHSPANH